MSDSERDDIDLDRDELLTPTQAAKLLKLHVSCVYRWVLRGKLRGWKRGRGVLVKRSDLDALLQPVVPQQERPMPVNVVTQRQRRKQEEEAREVLRRHGII